MLFSPIKRTAESIGNRKREQSLKAMISGVFNAKLSLSKPVSLHPIRQSPSKPNFHRVPETNDRDQIEQMLPKTSRHESVAACQIP
jgi:hypothetical protein